MTLSGCGSTKIVYPNECKVVSNIPIEKPDPNWMQPSSKPYEPTEEQLKSGMTTTEVLELVASKNNQLWQEDRDKLKFLQQHMNKILDKYIK